MSSSTAVSIRRGGPQLVTSAVPVLLLWLAKLHLEEIIYNYRICYVPFFLSFVVFNIIYMYMYIKLKMQSVEQAISTNNFSAK